MVGGIGCDSKFNRKTCAGLSFGIVGEFGDFAATREFAPQAPTFKIFFKSSCIVPTVFLDPLGLLGPMGPLESY